MEFIKFILDLGPTVMLPLVIFILGMCLGLKPGKAFKSGLTIGIGFVGIGLVIGLMLDSLGPAAGEMAKRLGMNLTVIDVGWPGASPVTWASSIAMVAIPIAILVNLVMLALKLTRVVNVDIWNIWHMTFTGALVNIATGSYMLGILGVVVHAAIAYKLGDWFAYETEEYFGLEGVAVPHGSSAYCAPIAVIVEEVIERIPGLNKINFNSEVIEEKFGVFGEPTMIGLGLGVVIGVMAGYDFKMVVQLGVKVAGVMYLMPKVVKPIMEGLSPIAKVAKIKLSEKFQGSDFLIGLDPALLLGDPSVVSAGLIFIPLTLIIAAIVPGNRVLPFGDLATIGFFIAMATGVHKGNLFRTLISGSIIMFGTIWISTQTIGYHTILGQNAGAVKAGAEMASLDQGGSPITYILLELLKPSNSIALIVIGAIYAVGIFLTYKRSKIAREKSLASVS